MRVILVALLLTAFTASAADIYRWTEQDGTVVFGDNPPEGVKAERIHVREPMTTPALRDAREILQGRGNNAGGDDTSPYERLAIASPGDNEPVRANAGNFSVQVDIHPALQTDRGHRLRLVMDGSDLQTGERTTFNLTNVDRGTHRILVQVLDRDGQVIQESGTVEFHLLRHHIN